jgi:GTP-binding protein Era
MDADAPKGRSGFAAIVGRPNVGKSTLLNRILGEKLAIVSPRPQTTRNRILGVHTVGADQVVLLDTPGIHRDRANLNRFMVQEALESLASVDVVLLLSEVTRGGRAELEAADVYVLEQIKIHEPRAPIVVVINKIDRLAGPSRQLLLPLMALWRDRGFERIVPTCALDGDGVDVLLAEVLALLPRGAHQFPAELLTDRPERFLAGELVREQVFLCCRQEVPYSTAVEVISFEERAGRGDSRLHRGAPEGREQTQILIEALIHVERTSQRAILVGKHGATIKAIGTAARQAIGRLLGCTVHLKLTVHVERDWTHSPQGRRRLGYE